MGLISAAYWRIYVTANGGGSYCGVNELQFRPTPGTNYQPGTGTATASSVDSSSHSAADAFDNNNSTSWESSTTSPLPQWLAYQYPSAITPQQIYIYGGFPLLRPITFDVQYSADGSTWTTLQSFSNVSYASNIFTGTIQTAQILVSDSASGSDSLSMQAGIGIADSASGIDSFSAAASAFLRDTGSGIEAISSAVEAFVSDSATGADFVPALTVALAISDSGKSTDRLTLNEQTLKTVGDAATASDAVSVTSTLSLTDHGSGQDSLLIKTSLSVADSASASELVNVAVPYLIQLTDSASGTDSLTIQAAINLQDNASGADTAVIQALLALADSGAAVETVVVGNVPTKITTITFTVSKASLQFALSQPSMKFTIN